jgi:hypothetical protein
MKAGFKVFMAWDWGNDGYNKILVVTNYHQENRIWNYPMVFYKKENRSSSDVGMWRVKTLKK